MGRVRKVNGEDVMTENDFAAWWAEHHVEGGIFIDVLRCELAGRLRLKNFRQLALTCGDQRLGPESHWMDAELVVVVQPYLTDVDTESSVQLVQAARDGAVPRVVSLLDRPLDPDTEFTVMMMMPCPRGIGYLEIALQAPMHAAALCPSPDVVRCLLAARADMNKANSEGWTPLHIAALRGNLTNVRCLLEAGAEKSRVNREGQTPLHYALVSERPDIACLLDDEGECEVVFDDARATRDILEATWFGPI
ncbi:unnamed protein product [Effrenium voratum]|nr:unnamed protein product [Effrenium voratum]